MKVIKAYRIRRIQFQSLLIRTNGFALLLHTLQNLSFPNPALNWKKVKASLEQIIIDIQIDKIYR